eukprot:RCo037328
MKSSRLVLFGLLLFGCLGFAGMSIALSWRKGSTHAEKCLLWRLVASYIIAEDVEGLQKLLEQERLAHPDVAGPIDKALHILEGSTAQGGSAVGPNDPPLQVSSSSSASAASSQSTATFLDVAEAIEPSTVLLPPILQWHYNASLMTAKFWEEARHRRDEVEQRWASEPLWRNYRFADISQCASRTPECLLWGLPAVNQSHARANKAYRKCCVEHGKLRATVADVFAALRSRGIPFGQSGGASCREGG